MFLSSYGDLNKRILFEKCHCPMDGIMMERISKSCNEYELPQIKWEIPWSKLKADEEDSIEEYKIFQNHIDTIAKTNGILPIEVDFLLWDE